MRTGTGLKGNARSTCMKYSVIETALFPLDTHPTTYDICSYLVVAKTMGAKHVRFCNAEKMADWKYTRELGWKRFGNITLPCVKLSGLTWSIGNRVPGVIHGYYTNRVNEVYADLGRVELLRPTMISDLKDYVTITFRESFRNKSRNSNRRAWEEFKSDLRTEGYDVVVFDECETEPIDVEQRMAYYSGAVMNFGCNNGPMGLCWYSQAPYLTFNMAPDEKTLDMMIRFRFPPGSQYAYRNPRQRLVWEPDEIGVIRKEWAAMKKELGAN